MSSHEYGTICMYRTSRVCVTASTPPGVEASAPLNLVQVGFSHAKAVHYQYPIHIYNMKRMRSKRRTLYFV